MQIFDIFLCVFSSCFLGFPYPIQTGNCLCDFSILGISWLGRSTGWVEWKLYMRHFSLFLSFVSKRLSPLKTISPMKEKELLKAIERDFHRPDKFSLFAGDEWKDWISSTAKIYSLSLDMTFWCGNPQREWSLGASGKLISVQDILTSLKTWCLMYAYKSDRVNNRSERYLWGGVIKD